MEGKHKLNIPLKDPNISKGFGVRYGAIYMQRHGKHLPIPQIPMTDENIIQRNIDMVKAGLLVPNMKGVKKLTVNTANAAG